MQVPIDPAIKEIRDIPYTISYVIRKRLQIDNFNEVSKEKRPPEKMIWEGTSEEIEDWFDKIFKRGNKPDGLIIDIGDVEE